MNQFSKQLRAAAVAVCTICTAIPTIAEARGGHTHGRNNMSREAAASFRQSGKASFYHAPYKNHGMTMAHLDLPKHTLVVVTNQDNDTSVCLSVEDNGPHIFGRIADVSEEAARQLGMTKKGVANVSLYTVPVCPKPKTTALQSPAPTGS